jgi:hypothetical protein
MVSNNSILAHREAALEVEWVHTIIPVGHIDIPVGHIDIETCKDCGGHVKIIACIEDPAVIEKILRHLERKDAAVTLHSPPSRGPPQGRLFG